VHEVLASIDPELPTRVARLVLGRHELAYLPNFRRAFESGVWRRLHSPADFMPGSVWPTFYTARSVGEHGVYHIVQWDPDAMRLRRVNPELRILEPFWRKLSLRGVKVIALDVPLSLAGAKTNAIEISGWGAHDQIGPFEASAHEIGSELMRRYGAHPMGIEVPVDKTLRQRMRIKDRLVQGVQIKREILTWLLTSQQCDLFIGVFGEAHRGGHILWPDGPEGESTIAHSALLDVYRALDAALGEVLSAIDLAQTTVMIFALHGMGENTTQEHFVGPLMDRINVKFSELEPGLYPSGQPPRQRSLMRTLRKKVPPSWQSAIANMVPLSVRDAVIDHSVTSGHDWLHTPGLGLRGDKNGYLRFNIRGRENQGMLERESPSLARYENLIRESLSSVRALDGTLLVRDVSSPGEHFKGAALARLPDLIVRWNDVAPVHQINSSSGLIDGELGSGRGGNHRADGFQIILQPGARSAAEAEAIPITALASIVLGSFGIDAGSD
jgi:predicted AlkP superfamily phosphohydrolase/phosphomutase